MCKEFSLCCGTFLGACIVSLAIGEVSLRSDERSGSLTGVGGVSWMGVVGRDS